MILLCCICCYTVGKQFSAVLLPQLQKFYHASKKFLLFGYSTTSVPDWLKLRTSTATSCLSRVMMLAKRSGLASMLRNIRGLLPSFARLLSFAVNGEFSSVVSKENREFQHPY